MTTASYALVVAPTLDLARRLASCLSSCGLDVKVATDFIAARYELSSVRPPRLLVTELKLGAFNGLHLALRAKNELPPVTTIVIGEPDPVLEAEARRQDVPYVVHPFEDGALLNAVRAASAWTEPVPSDSRLPH